ncbi:MAG: AI-2E family transporter [Gammaproteobacteria bacterium]|nr:AI-2E family transporter [Gammaproteobacteria bacterium]MDE2461888.1 AI-2E family transporter [Gammaproteobacteria bacterium]
MTTTQKIWTLFIVVIVAVLIHYLRPVLVPFFASFILAYLGHPLVDRLERWKLPRTLAVLAVFVLTLVVLGLILVLVIPMVVREIAALFAHAPEVLAWFQTHVLPWLTAHFGVQPGALQPAKLMDLVSSNFTSAGKLAGQTLLTVSSSAAAVFEFFINLILIPVVTFYLLRDWHPLMQRIVALVPHKALPTVTRLARECDAILGAFLRGQLLVMVALAIFYSVVLALIGLDNAVAIGVVAGVLCFVPYLGIITGIALALITALLQGGGWLLLWVVIVFIVGQILNDLLLTPRLVGERIGLHPALVIFAILVGGALFGFAGILLALPVAAAGTVLIRYARERYVESRLYQGDDGGAP